MALKSFERIKTSMAKKSARKTTRLTRNRARVSIEEMLDEYLKNPGEVLTFEALPDALDSTIQVIEEEPLNIKFDITQIDETLFQASLKEIEI